MNAAQPSPEPLLVPAQRLVPSPGGDRRLRRATTLVGTAIVLLVVLGLGLLSTATWLAGRGYSEVPATTGLGSPAALTLDLRMGDVRVLPSGDVDELTLALVEPGETTLPAGGDRVPARLSESVAAGRTTVEVRQPTRSFGPPWSDGSREVLLLVPTDLDLALAVHTDVGDVLVDGEFASLEAHSDYGDIDIELSSPAPTSIDISAATGDVDLLLPTDAGGRVTITADLGDVEVAAPGTGRWQVRARSDLGEVHTDPGLAADSGETIGTLTVTSDLGRIDISR